MICNIYQWQCKGQIISSQMSFIIYKTQQILEEIQISSTEDEIKGGIFLVNPSNTKGSIKNNTRAEHFDG